MPAAKEHALDCEKGSAGRRRGPAGEEKRVNGRAGDRGPEQLELRGAVDTEGGGTGLKTDTRRGRSPESGPDRPLGSQTEHARLENMTGDTPRLDGHQEGQGSVGESEPRKRAPLSILTELPSLQEKTEETRPALKERQRMQHAKEILSHKTEIEDGKISDGSRDKNWMRVRAEPAIRRKRSFWDLLFGVDDTTLLALQTARREVRHGRFRDG